MLEIDYRIPQKTIEMESNRPIESMDMDDLSWCFASQVDFTLSKDNPPTIRLPDVAMLEFVTQISKAKKNICECGHKAAKIEDLEGMYFLDINVIGQNVFIEDVGGRATLETSIQGFCEAVGAFVNKVITDMPAIFPSLKDNPHYKAHIRLID